MLAKMDILGSTIYGKVPYHCFMLVVANPPPASGKLFLRDHNSVFLLFSASTVYSSSLGDKAKMEKVA